MNRQYPFKCFLTEVRKLMTQLGVGNRWAFSPAVQDEQFLRPPREFDNAVHLATVRDWEGVDFGIKHPSREEEMLVHLGVPQLSFQRVQLCGDHRIFCASGGVAVAIGAQFDNWVYLLFDPCVLDHPGRVVLRHRSQDDDDVFSHPVDMVLEILHPALERAAEYVKSYTWKNERSAFAKAATKRFQRRVERLREMVTDNEERGRRLQSELQQTISVLVSQRKELDNAENMMRCGVAELGKQFDCLMSLASSGEIEKVRFTDTEILATVKPFTLEHGNTSVDFSQMEVVINFSQVPHSLSVLALDNEGPDGYYHPHVDRNGYPCLGNISKGVSTLLEEGEFAAVVGAMVTFLGSYNPHAPYVNLSEWDESSSRFDNCFEDGVNECISCSDSDCPHWESRFDRCRDSDEQCLLCSTDECPYYKEARNRCRDQSTLSACLSCRFECEHALDIKDEKVCRQRAVDEALNEESEKGEGIHCSTGCSSIRCSWHGIGILATEEEV